MWVNLSLLILIPYAEIYSVKLQFRSIQSLSCVQLFATPCTVAPQASLSFTNSRSLLKIMSVRSAMPSNHLLLYHPLLIPPSIFPSIRVFSNESFLHIRWPNYSGFRVSTSFSNEYSELISFRMDWFDLLAVQGTLKSLLSLLVINVLEILSQLDSAYSCLYKKQTNKQIIFYLILYTVLFSSPILPLRCIFSCPSRNKAITSKLFHQIYNIYIFR